MGISQDIGERLTEGLSLHAIGLVACRLENCDYAYDVLKRASEVIQEIGYRPVEGGILVSLGEVLCANQQFDEAIDTARYILNKLDSNSTEAKSIIEKAKAELEKLAKQKAEELKKGVTDKLGSFGQ